MKYYIPSWVQNELFIDEEVRFGDWGKDVKKVQEWLVYHGYKIMVDGIFGDATAYSVKNFQKRRGLTINGVVDHPTFRTLLDPLYKVLEKPTTLTIFNPILIILIKRHLRYHPIEIGGQNRGPWVRMYMQGYDGDVWAWCAGAVSFILHQAFDTFDQSLKPILDYTFSVDALVTQAKTLGRFIDGTQTEVHKKLRPGFLFVNRRSDVDWTHTGFVLAHNRDIFVTAEGNTNNEGGREGYEMVSRIRSYRNKDFIDLSV